LGACQWRNAEAQVIVNPTILGKVEEHVVGVEAIIASELKDVEMLMVECAEVFKEVIGASAMLIIRRDDSVIDRLLLCESIGIVLGTVAVAIHVAPETTRLQL
jgi:hypothetical protein